MRSSPTPLETPKAACSDQRSEVVRVLIKGCTMQNTAQMRTGGLVLGPVERLARWLGQGIDSAARGLRASLAGVSRRTAYPRSPSRLRTHLPGAGMWVLCASCGTAHELEAVCHRCGAPLCSDTRHCRLSRYHAQLGQRVVCCATCASLP